MKVDVVIIGGSFSGLSAAMQLVRARRSVLVVDTNKPRNRFAEKSHGVFCLDGKSPSEIRFTALSQLREYPDFQLIEDEAVEFEKTDTGFRVITQSNLVHEAKKLVLATGIVDEIPDIPGLSEHWGKSVVHCPYCHGYELSDRRLGVLATSDLSFHQAAMIPDWGVTTLFTQGRFHPDAEVLNHLLARGVQIEDTPITEVIGDGENLQYLLLEDDRRAPIEALYIGPKVKLATKLVDSLDLELQDTPLGSIIKVDDFKESSVKGVFVAGDMSNPMQSATLAIASGTIAGVAAHRSLIFE